MAVSYMTVDGYKKLEKEIEQLESVERPKISQQIAEARDKGDLSENAEYDAAKEAQGMLEMKISQLKELFLNARILDESKINTDSVQILTCVTLFNTKTKQEFEYTIVSESEANLKEKKISVSTPIAKGLLGKKVGDIAEINVPAGAISLEIRKIELAK
jgi:transcription elongation factor GreA